MQTILNNSYDEIAHKAAECGIDWEKARHFVDFSGRKTNLNKNTLSSKYNGKVIMYANIKTDKAGVQYPFISFYTAKHGGVSESFNGWEASREGKEKGIFTREFIPLPRMTETAKELAEEAKKQGLFDTTLARFKKLPQETGTSPYFLRKFGERDADFYAGDLRRDSTSAIYAIKTHDKGITGFQQIFDEAIGGTGRDKNFIGKTSGGFSVIGDESRINTDGAIFCEGYATTLSAYHSPYKRGGAMTNPEKLPGVVCLDANNLEKVVREASARGCKNIIIGADNDAGHNNVIGNPGVYHALKVAREVGAMVYIPSISTGKKCDFNDTLNATKLDMSAGSELAFLIQLMKYAPKREFKKIARSMAFEISKEIPRKYSIDTAVAFIESALAKREFSAGFSVHSIIKREVKKTV